MLLFPDSRLDFTRNTYLTIVFSILGVFQQPEGLEIIGLLDPFFDVFPCFSPVSLAPSYMQYSSLSLSALVSPLISTCVHTGWYSSFTPK